MPLFLPLSAQTTYAELVDLCAVDEFDTSFPPNGSFVAVTVKQRRYWYYQSGAKDATGRQPRKYVGPDNDSTAKLVARHGRIKSSYRRRRSMVSALRRYGLPTAPDQTGKILQGLAEQGIFRLRACVVGTVAYQTYGGILGAKLPAPTLQTGDLDLAQSRAISVAIAEDEPSPSILNILQTVDPSFRPIPHLHSPNIAANYINGEDYRVEILTDNRGPDSDDPVELPALRTHAQPLRFLDYLLRDTIPAVVLSNGGVLVNVPQPERYAVHKLIVAERRAETAVKRPKDLYQASALFDALAEHRARDLAAAWTEAYERGPQWRKHLRSALAHLDPTGCDRLLYSIGQSRAFVPDLDIEFRDSPPRYDFSRDVVLFAGLSKGRPIDCAVSRATLDDWFGAEKKSQGGHLQAFLDNRSQIQAMAREIYLNGSVPADGEVLVKTTEISTLRKKLKSKVRRRTSASR